jgi:hypothetical protein
MRLIERIRHDYEGEIWFGVRYEVARADRSVNPRQVVGGA